jgi:2-polyprenyl-3-methyl-5-hydroxy-6-metoxy-1,4-benzoquinol methylase
MDKEQIRQLHHSWEVNGERWTAAVRNGAIESRRVATDKSILRAALALRPRKVLDLGCGEGWLVRALEAQGIHTTGLDGSESLIAAAWSGGSGQFRHVQYADLIACPELAGHDFELIIANFSLLEEQLGPLLKSLGSLLTPLGTLLIQTVHPLSVPLPYSDGWRTEDVHSFGDKHWQAMPWYFRTLSSWLRLLQDHGFVLHNLQEPTHPTDGRPLSLLLSAKYAPKVSSCFPAVY